MNYLKSALMMWSFYALGYFIFWLYGIFDGWAWPTFISWLTLMIVAVIYDNGEIGIKEVGGSLVEIILAILALILFPLVVLSEVLLPLIRKNKKGIILIFKKSVAGIFLLTIWASFFYLVNYFCKMSLATSFFVSLSCFVGSGVILFLYIILFAPIVAGWFTQKLEDKRSSPGFWLRISNQIVVAVHICLLLPVCWLTDE